MDAVGTQTRSSPRRLIVTGASGFLGRHVCRAARHDWNVTGVTWTHTATIPGVSTVVCDLTDHAAVSDLFSRVDPQALIHTAALSDPNRCQTEPELSLGINVEASTHLAGLCAGLSIPCVFTSTDLVFNGLNPPYREQDPVTPLSIYGEHKCLAESGMLRRHPRAVICRMPLMFGAAEAPAQSFLQPMARAFSKGESLRLFVDEFRTPVGAPSAAGGLLQALGFPGGVYHLGGKRRISRYELGQLVARVLGVKADIIPVRQAEVSMAAPRPPDVSLDSSLACALGYTPLELETELKACLS